jgi:hypothetical protein
MFAAPRHGFVAALLLTLTTLALLTSMLHAQPQSSPVIVAKLTSFSGTSEKGSFAEALDAAVHHAASAGPSGRPTIWKVTRISGMSQGAEAPIRVIVTVEAHW